MFLALFAVVISALFVIVGLISSAIPWLAPDEYARAITNPDFFRNWLSFSGIMLLGGLASVVKNLGWYFEKRDY